MFTVGEKVTVTGTSKGKGFAGVVKRWGFKGGQRTRGQSDRLRAPVPLVQVLIQVEFLKERKWVEEWDKIQ